MAQAKQTRKPGAKAKGAAAKAKAAGAKAAGAEGEPLVVGDDALDAVTPGELAERGRRAVERVKQGLAELDALLHALTPDAREKAPRFREGEVEALRAVLTGADLRPHLLGGVAAEDHGVDPKRFETDLLRRRLDNYEALAQVEKDFAAAVPGFLQRLGDTRLRLADRARGPTMKAYRKLEPHIDDDPELATPLATTVAFLGAPAKKAAQTKARRKTRET